MSSAIESFVRANFRPRKEIAYLRANQVGNFGSVQHDLSLTQVAGSPSETFPSSPGVWLYRMTLLEGDPGDAGNGALQSQAFEDFLEVAEDEQMALIGNSMEDGPWYLAGQIDAALDADISIQVPVPNMHG